MRFYYQSIFSLIFIAILYAVVLGVIWVVWVKFYKRKFSGPAAWSVVALVLVAPWLEEFWIAWNFGQLCRKDAGIVINKTVEVDGFYDSTMRSAYENTKPGRYQFVEHETENRRGFERVQRASEEEKAQALSWYAKNNLGKERPKDRSIFHQLSEKEMIAVLPNGVDAWRITKLDKPTARYHFAQTRGVPVTHKVTKQSSSVTDTQTREILGRYTVVSRDAPWFFIHLSRPRIGCDGPHEGPNPTYRNSFLIYRDILKPRASLP